MDIIIQSLGFTIGEALDSFIKEKVSSLKGDKIVLINSSVTVLVVNIKRNNSCFLL